MRHNIIMKIDGNSLFLVFSYIFRLIESEEGPVPKYNSLDHFNYIHFRIRYEAIRLFPSIYIGI